MSYVNWKIKGPKVATCNCDFGCPCEFVAPPTNANLCEGVEIMRIDEGWFGEGADQVRLDGLLVGARYRWPGPLHKGGGIVQGLFEERTSEAQREALFKILGGEEQEPTTVFNIYGSTIETEYDPLFGVLDFAVDFKARTAKFTMPGVTEMRVEPIKNPVTGLDYFSQIALHSGFEYRTAEMASATFTSSGDQLPMNYKEVYAALFYGAYGPYGILPDEASAGFQAALAA